MKILKTLSISFLLATAAVSPGIAANPAGSALYAETPARTVYFKHPMAGDINKFLSSSTMYHFEVYKPGSEKEIAKIMQAFKSDAAVENINAGIVTGDFHAFDVNLKSAKDKQWFIERFKAAGINNIKINNNPVVEVEKL